MSLSLCLAIQRFLLNRLPVFWNVFEYKRHAVRTSPLAWLAQRRASYVLDSVGEFGLKVDTDVKRAVELRRTRNSYGKDIFKSDSSNTYQYKSGPSPTLISIKAILLLPTNAYQYQTISNGIKQ